MVAERPEDVRNSITEITEVEFISLWRTTQEFGAELLGVWGGKRSYRLEKDFALELMFGSLVGEMRMGLRREGSN